MSDPFATLETRIVTEIANINLQIGNLEQDRSALRRMLARARSENLSSHEAIRSNSTGRILVEQAILQHLRSLNGRTASVRELIVTAQSVDLKIKDPTFRSHLHRLKLRGLVESPEHGRWRAVTTIQNAQKTDENETTDQLNA